MSTPEFGALPDAVREDPELADDPRVIRGALTLAFKRLSERLQRVETLAFRWDVMAARMEVSDVMVDLDEIQRLTGELAASGD